MQCWPLLLGSGPAGRCHRRKGHPAVAPLPEEVLCDQGSNLTPLANTGAIPEKEASPVPVGQEVLVPGTSQVHCTRL